MIKFIHARNVAIQPERHSVMHIVRPVTAGRMRMHVVIICTHKLMLYTLKRYFHFCRTQLQQYSTTSKYNTDFLHCGSNNWNSVTCLNNYNKYGLISTIFGVKSTEVKKHSISI